MKNSIKKNIRSPFFYVGDKYKLVPQLLSLFPEKIKYYVEPFYGGGSSQLQVRAKEYLLNDCDENIIRLHKFLLGYANNSQKFFNKVFKIIDKYNLSCSYNNINVPMKLKIKFPKTYYSYYNKQNYNKMKNDYNNSRDDFLLYLLLIYGFNHMLRFNKNNEFNLPVGNIDFNKNVYIALQNYFNLQKERKIKFFTLDFEQFLNSVKNKKDTFVYVDPPYLISSSEYNKKWIINDEKRLYYALDKLNDKGIRFGVTNLLHHKNKTNEIFLNWMKSYSYEKINSNYISFNDNSIKKQSEEYFVFNY